MRNYKIAASLVCANMLNIEAEIREIEKSDIEYIHFDVMDGHFVPRLGLHPEMLVAVHSITQIPIDVHLMISNPEKYIPLFVGADIISVHAESTSHLHYVVKMIKNMGIKAGVTLNHATPLNVLDYIIDDLDQVMLMAINPGIVGHKLIPKALDKISDLKKRFSDRPDLIIEIDGGVTLESAPEMIRRGANMLVCGSSTIFRNDDKFDWHVKNLRDVIDKSLL